MKQLLKIFFWGMLISFLGSLPLGTMNVMATNISVKDGVTAAMIYATGSMLVEIIYVRIALVAMSWVARQQKIFRFFEWLTLVLILALAIGSFVAAVRMSGLGSALPENTSHPFWLGAFFSATNPLHIPFWFGWSTVLLNKNILLPRVSNYNWYVCGIGLGTMAGFAVFIYGGNYLVQQMNANQNLLNWAIGIILLITAMIQLYKMLNKPAVVVIRNLKS
jgi:threonine/homoserine/homoserine lactone efflux protein